jgi:large subunit ribosomal protein L24
MQRIRRGDDVIIIAGKDKGRRGTVLKVIDDNHIVVEGVSIVKKHQKPNPNAGVTGGINEQEGPIHTSNVMLFNPATGKGDRVGFKLLEDNKKVRYFKSNSEVVDI